MRELLPCYHGVPTGRWLTIVMNRINPALFSAFATTQRLVLGQEAVREKPNGRMDNYCAPIVSAMQELSQQIT